MERTTTVKPYDSRLTANSADRSDASAFFADHRPATAAQRRLIEAANQSVPAGHLAALGELSHSSPRGVAQRQELDMLFGHGLTRAIDHPSLDSSSASERATAAPMQMVLDETATGFVDEKLQAEGLGTYADIVDRLSPAKVAELDSVWKTIGHGKKRARKVVAANQIVNKIKAYLQIFAEKALLWTAATYPSARASMEDHCVRHPGAWGDVQEYTDAAINLKTARWAHRFDIGQADRKRMETATHFLITTDAGLIVTFGQR